MAKPGRMLTPAGIKRVVNILLDGCRQACRAEETTAECEASIELRGDYEVDKYGDIKIGVDVGATIPDNIPVDADFDTDWERETGASGDGTVTVRFTVRMKSEGWVG